MGPNQTFDGISIFNHIVRILQTQNGLAIKNIIKDFLTDNSDLNGLTHSLLISYLKSREQY